VTLKDQTKFVLAENVLMNEEDKSRKLLSTVLPARIMQRRLLGERDIFQSAPEISVLRVDFSDFISSREWFIAFERVISDFDNVLKKFLDLTRISAVGNIYMVAGGLFEGMSRNCLKDTIAAGIEMMSRLELFNMETHSAIELSIAVTIGGPIFAGVLELGCPNFELYGVPYDQIEALRKRGLPWTIVIPSSVYELVYSEGFRIKEGDMMECRGVKTKTYLVRRYEL
jgi:hypothetical protein